MRVASQNPELKALKLFCGKAAAHSQVLGARASSFWVQGRAQNDALAWAAISQAGYKTGSVGQAPPLYHRGGIMLN